MKFSRKCAARVMILAATFMMVLLMSVPVAAAKHSTVYQGQDYRYVYDYDYYTTEVHPELAGKKDATVLYHFTTKGMAKAEQAISTFNVKSYYYGNQDLRLEYGKNWKEYYMHFQNTGHSVASRVKTAAGITKLKNPVTIYNGMDYAKVYNYNYYCARHPEVAKAYPDDDYAVLKYFVTVGIPKEHKGCSTFYVRSYRFANPDLRAKFGSKYRNYYVHYMKYGYKNRQSTAIGVTSIRNPITSYNGVDYSSIYDFNYYVTKYSVAAKYKNDDYAAIKHFVTSGLLAGLQAKSGVSSSSTAYKTILEKIYPNSQYNEYRKAYQYSSETEWLILLDQGNHVVNIFQGDHYSWKKVKSFSCTVGKPSTSTPQGIFTIGDRGLYFNTESNRCWYYTQFYGSILFHSVIYSGYYEPRYIVDGRLGMNLSHGCVRLQIDNAYWIYKNIPRRTKVVSYNRPW